MRPSPATIPRPLLIALGLCAAACGALAAWRPGLFFVDDAWFYLQIGRNLALGHGSTFHGEGATNGYHPLWQGIVALVGLASGGAKGPMLAGVLGLQLLLVAYGCASLVRAGQRAGLSFPGLVLCTVILGLLADRGWGSEGMLNLALHGAAILAWQRILVVPSAGRALAAGLVAGLLVLARLDVAFFALALVLVAAWRLREPRLLLPLGLGLALPVLPYVAANTVLFGHPVPVSGAIKSTFPVPELSNPLAKLGPLGTAALLLGGVNLVLAGGRDTPGRPLLLALGLGAVLHGGYTALFTAPRWATEVVYYYVTGVIGAGFCLGELARRYLRLLPSLSPQGGRWLVGGLGLALGLGAVGKAAQGAVAFVPETEALARWLARELPADARVLTTDAPGRLAWVSGLPVHALDGLTQPPGFGAELQALGVETWAREHGITHLVTQRKDYDAPWVLIEALPGGLRLTAREPHSRTPAGSFHLADPPLVDLCELVPAGACSNQVAVWAWPEAGGSLEPSGVDMGQQR